MAIPKGKERRQITLTDKAWERLERDLAEAKKKYRFWNVGHVTVSTIIEEMVFEKESK